MSSDGGRLLDHVEQMEIAAEKALSFVAGMSKSSFLTDEKTQMAVAMALVILGENVTRILALNPHIDTEHPQVPWVKIKGMRDLVAHDYYELQLDVVWKTLQDDLPPLLSQLRMLRQIRAQGE
ncbi:HepT-like ribonuclease domain-containing protein [Rhizobium sp. 0TCS1.26]|uniref:HepT-like ribonuclease domain-containing protein n=1 Tax=Rhizobium sp. 0TCS1.26 TaxID=3142623 RepID=UPI003D2D356F